MIAKYKTEIKWAFIFIGALLLWMLLERLFGLHDEHIDKQQYITILFVIPAIWLYVLALKEKKRKDYHGQMSFRQGFVAGMIITVIVTVFSPLTQWIISEIITPDYFDTVINYAVESGYDDRESAEAYFTYQNYAVQSTIWAFIMGVITSAGVAWFMKSKPQ